MNNIQNYNIENLRNKKFWVSTPTEKNWQEVCEVFQRAGIKWHSGNEATSIQWNGKPGILYYQCNEPTLSHGTYEEGYIKITAQEFITANQPTDMTTTEKIEALEKQLQELKQSLVDWKPGDKFIVIQKYLTTTGTMVTADKKADAPTYHFQDKENGHQWIIGTQVRKATPEEIERATPREIRVTIGTKGKEVVISKGKIVAPDSKTVDISNVKQVIDIMGGKIQFSGWGVTFPIVKIGCIEGITYDQLQAVQEAYSKLTNN